MPETGTEKCSVDDRIPQKFHVFAGESDDVISAVENIIFNRDVFSHGRKSPAGIKGAFHAAVAENVLFGAARQMPQIIKPRFPVICR